MAYYNYGRVDAMGDAARAASHHEDSPELRQHKCLANFNGAVFLRAGKE
jgi:hypothetical protein